MIAFNIILLIISLGALVGYKIWEKHNVQYEMVELDENDPEYKRLAEQRNALVSTIFEHLSVNLSISTETINDTCEINNLDPERTNIKFASTDTICRMTFFWDKKVKIVLFNNRKMRGKTVQMSKTFRIVDNNIDAAKLTKFAVKFRIKAYRENDMKINDLEAGCLAIAKEIAEKMTVDELKEKFVAEVLDVSLADYKKPTDNASLYAISYAVLMKFCRTELDKALGVEKEQRQKEKEPE